MPMSALGVHCAEDISYPPALEDTTTAALLDTNGCSLQADRWRGMHNNE
jgi:hypothetical protein